MIEKSSESSGRANFNRGRGSNNGGRGRYGNFGRVSHFTNMKC